MSLRYVIAIVFAVAMTAGMQAPAQAATCPLLALSPLPVRINGQITAIAIDDACATVYAANATFNRVEVFSLSTGRRVPSIAVGSHPAALAIDPDRNVLYVSNGGARNLSVVDLSTGIETRRVDVPTISGNAEAPGSMAVAKSGLVLFTTTFSGTGFGGHLMQFDPTDISGTPVTVRSDYGSFGATEDGTILVSSGDRSTIAIAGASSTETDVYTYRSATDKFTYTAQLNDGRALFALNSDGSLGWNGCNLIDMTSGASKGATNACGGFGVALDPTATKGYSSSSIGLSLEDLVNFQNVSTLPAGDDILVSTSQGALTTYGITSISRDGTLLAVTTANGFSLINSANAVAAIHISAFPSSSSGLQSLLRFYNTGNLSGVRVTLMDYATGSVLAHWDSPPIPIGTAPQYSMSQIEAAATPAFTKPQRYLLSIQPRVGMEGTMTHVGWDATNGTLTNLSTCDIGVTSTPTRLVNVHSSLLKADYPSFIEITNTGGASVSVLLGIYDARNGNRLGGYNTAAIPAAGALLLPMSDIETNLGLSPSGDMYHYVVQAETPFSGHMQHFIQNSHAAVITDMTAVCALPAPSDFLP